jgi:hypothetical protein
MVWRGHASRQLVTLILVTHVVCLLWLCGTWQRVRLLAYDFHQVPTEAFLTQPPEALRALGYSEDDPAELEQFRAIAMPIIEGATNDGERMRRLGDYIYSLRREGHREADDEPRIGPSALFAELREGQIGSCAQDSAVLAAFWRSLGGHTRGIHWTTAEGAAFHFAVELYSSAQHRWMYYDMNLNGYGSDDAGTPVSVTALRSRLLTGEDLHLVASPTAHDWTEPEFRDFLREYPVEWYVLNNSTLYFEPGRRFGRFNSWYPVLSRLPYPSDRIADNVLGARDRRLVVDGKIQMGGVFSHEGARLWLGYLVIQVAFCTGTLLRARAQSAPLRR